MNPEKLAKLQASVRIGGKGTPRRKVKKVAKPTGGDDKKLQAALKKLNVQPIPGIEEVNMFRSDGHVLHFVAPKVQASVASNTFVINGEAQDKDLSELIPDILPQMGAEALANIRKLAESFQAQQAAAGASAENKDEDVPDLVESFDQ